MARLAIVALTVVCAALSILLWCTAPAFVLRQPVDASPAAASPSAVAARPSAGPQRVPPPSVLFRAIIEMQKDPATAFTGEQRTRVKGLLREWTKKFKRSKF